jgi:hypothetical protein
MHPTRIFKKPEELEKAWKDYKEDLKEKSKVWKKVQYVGKEGIKKTDSPKLPFTYEGFKRFCWDKNIGTVNHYFENTDERYNDFCDICTRVKNEIREDQITGGLLSFYNASITQRLNNLVEKQEIKIEDVEVNFED